MNFSMTMAMFALAFADADCPKDDLFSGPVGVAAERLYSTNVVRVSIDSVRLDEHALRLVEPAAVGATTADLDADLDSYLSLHKQVAEQGTGVSLTPWLQLRSAGETGPARVTDAQPVLSDLSDECL